ncbi:MAG: SpoIIE family protein phosphatase [Phycisphaerales bacterium]|nr:SpoIIE family protein phosphatase [Phycisphaerales bacterium]
MARPHIQVIVAGDRVPECLRGALASTHATSSFMTLGNALHAEALQHAAAVVLVLPDAVGPLSGPLRILFDRLEGAPRATLLITSSGRPVPTLRHPPSVPVTDGSNLDEAALGSRLAALLSMRKSLHTLHTGLVANRRTGEHIAQRYMRQLRLASQVQRGFLPTSLPQLPGLQFDALFRPVDYVSGDIYDVHRLDEEHVAIALADATGHGISAALLTVYIKRALRGKEIHGGRYRILPPDEVLQGLNRDIQDAELSDCSFVAAVYGVLNTRTRSLALARGGTPYPLLRSANGKLSTVTSAGSVVGVMPHPHFEVAYLQLEPGDSLVLYSDGLERMVLPEYVQDGVPAGLRRAAARITGWNRTAIAAAERSATQPVAALSAPVLAAAGSGGSHTATQARPRPHTNGDRGGQVFSASAAEQVGRLRPKRTTDVLHSNWARTLEREGCHAALAQLAGRQKALRRLGFPLDDLTVVTLQIDD